MLRRIVFFIAFAACSPLAEDSKVPPWHRIGEPKLSVQCRYEVEDNDCNPIVLTKERIRKPPKPFAQSAVRP